MVRVLCVVALVGCNWVYGLDETTVRGPDLDGDGFVEDDLCPTLYTEVQKDSDGDHVGDECDPCMMGAQLYVDADRDGIDDGCDVCARGPGDHDEDKDGFVDACDNCPGKFNMAQDNADGDDLGDLCDPDTTVAFAQHRILFAGFETSPEGWYADEAWGVAGDSIGPVEQVTIVGPPEGLWNRTPAASNPTWMLEVGVKVPQSPVQNQKLGIAVRPRNGTNFHFCHLFFETVWKFGSSASAGAQISVGPFARIRMGSQGSTFFCQIDDNAPAAMTLTTNELEKTPVMYTSRMPTEFAYLDFLD